MILLALVYAGIMRAHADCGRKEEICQRIRIRVSVDSCSLAQYDGTQGAIRISAVATVVIIALLPFRQVPGPILCLTGSQQGHADTDEGQRKEA